MTTQIQKVRLAAFFKSNNFGIHLRENVGVTHSVLLRSFYINCTMQDLGFMLLSYSNQTPPCRSLPFHFIASSPCYGSLFHGRPRYVTDLVQDLTLSINSLVTQFDFSSFVNNWFLQDHFNWTNIVKSSTIISPGLA